MTYSIIDLSTGRPFDEEISDGPIAEGKTKKLYHYGDDLAVYHKDKLTAFDDPNCVGEGLGKGIIDTYVTSVLSKILQARGVPVAHKGIINANTTLEEDLNMMPFEIIWRRFNVEGNSWEKRNPGVVKIGEKYPEVIYEACLKWSVRSKDGEIIHDPFLVLENGIPRTASNGMPFLTHPKTGKKIEYTAVLDPHNPTDEISHDEVRLAITDFQNNADTIWKYTRIAQEAVFETYEEIGQVNCDGKLEYGKKGKVVMLGDSVDLDSVRNLIPTKIVTAAGEKEIEIVLGKSLSGIIDQSAEKITQILAARHSTKQVFRKLLDPWRLIPMCPERQNANDLAAQVVTREFYLPLALALSNTFGERARYVLQAA